MVKKSINKQKISPFKICDISNEQPNIAELGREHISQLVKGNGADEHDVRLVASKLENFSFTVMVRPNFQEKLTENKIVGNKGAGEVCGSKEDMLQKIAVLKQNYAQDAHILFLLFNKLKKLPHMGWGRDNKIILDELTHNYIYSEQCSQCQGARENPCSKCHGKGNIPCFNCKGFGLMDCLYCHATGRVADGQGGQKECPKCYGRIKTKCTECLGKKYMICDLCRGSRYIPCKNCGQTGYLSVQTKIEFEILATATIDEKQLPTSILKLYEQKGQEKLATELHAKVTLLASDEVKKATELIKEEIDNNAEASTNPHAISVAENNTQNIVIVDNHILHYLVEIPVAKAEISIAAKRYGADIVGYQAWFSNIDNFIDILIKPAIVALQKISKGPMAQQSLINKALKYRIIKEIFSNIGKKSKGQIFKMLKFEYPHGLSDKYAKAAIKFADIAISKITEKPKIKAVIASSLLSTVIFAIWFLVPLRKFIQNMDVNTKFYIDITLLAVISFASHYIVRLFAAKSLKKLVASYNSGDASNIKEILPPAKNHGIYAIFITFAIFLIMAYMSPVSPLWLSKIGIG